MNLKAKYKSGTKVKILKTGKIQTIKEAWFDRSFFKTWIYKMDSGLNYTEQQFEAIKETPNEATRN